MRCFCFPSIFENSHFWKQKFVIFIIFLEMFQNPKSWCFLFQPQFRNVLKATNNSLYPFFQDFPEFEVLEINNFLFSLANLKFSFFLQISNLEIPFYRIPILPGKISKPLSFRLEIESHFTEIPFYRESSVPPEARNRSFRSYLNISEIFMKIEKVFLVEKSRTKKFNRN